MKFMAILKLIDAVGRLTERTSPGGERREYSHDAAGRKTAERHSPQGSATPSQTIAYHYDGNNRLTGYTQSGDTHSAARYTYDPQGRRIQKQTPTWYLYSDEGLIAELDQTGQPTRYYGWKPDSLWSTDPLWLADKTTASPNTWKIHLYHTDHLGTPQRLTDTQGQTQWSARTEAFGKTVVTIDSHP